MQITLDLYQLQKLCAEFSELGAAQYARHCAPAKDSITQREAFRRFKESRVRRWVEAGLVTSYRQGETSRSPKVYSLAQLLSAEKAERINGMIQLNKIKGKQ